MSMTSPGCIILGDHCCFCSLWLTETLSHSTYLYRLRVWLGSTLWHWVKRAMHIGHATRAPLGWMTASQLSAKVCLHTRVCSTPTVSWSPAKLWGVRRGDLPQMCRAQMPGLACCAFFTETWTTTMTTAMLPFHTVSLPQLWVLEPAVIGHCSELRGRSRMQREGGRWTEILYSKFLLQIWGKCEYSSKHGNVFVKRCFHKQLSGSGIHYNPSSELSQMCRPNPSWRRLLTVWASS